ncbi:unnamed protein product [Symbiodinium sp. CCMP2592]|nr:unnamed protein product [Symbiodinium sp. CCMP2592]
MAAQQETYHALKASELAWARANTLRKAAAESGLCAAVCEGCTGLPEQPSVLQNFKEAMVIMRDRVARHAVGHARSFLNDRETMNYVAYLNRDNGFLSQIRNAYYKLQSDVLLGLIGNYALWETFCPELWQDPGDIEYHTITQEILKISEPGYAGMLQLSMKAQWLFLQLRVEDNNRVSLDLLVQEQIDRARFLCVSAVRNMVVALHHFRQDLEGSGILSSDEGQRKARTVQAYIMREILAIAFSCVGVRACCHFEMVYQLLQECVPKAPESIVHMLRKEHKLMQSNLLKQLIMSKSVWCRTMSDLERKSMPKFWPNSESQKGTVRVWKL